MHSLYISVSHSVIVYVTAYSWEESGHHLSDQLWVLTCSLRCYAVCILYIVEIK